MNKNCKRKDPLTGRVLPDRVSYRHSDGRYVYRYSIKGKPKFMYAKDLDEMKSKISRLQVDIAQGINLDMSKLKLCEWFPQYMETYKKRKLKESTYSSQFKFYDWYIKGSVIDNTRISEIKHIMLVKHFQDLADKKGLGHGTLRSLASILYNCLEQARFDGAIVGVNPATDIMGDVVAQPAEIRNALSKEEVALMIEFLKQEGTWQNVYLPAFAIGLSTGLRFGELFGLTWRDVDFKNHVIDINHSINYRDRGNGKHEFFITDPKTENAFRKFPMTEEIEKLFKMQKQYQKDMRIRNDIKIDGYKDFVFTAKTGIPYTHEAVVRALKLVVKRANEWEAERAVEEEREPVVIDVHTPHVWRHTFTTRMVEARIPYEELKMLLGHSSIKTTIDIYNHVSKDVLKRSRNSVEGVIKLL